MQSLLRYRCSWCPPHHLAPQKSRHALQRARLAVSPGSLSHRCWSAAVATQSSASGNSTRHKVEHLHATPLKSTKQTSNLHCPSVRGARCTVCVLSGIHSRHVVTVRHPYGVTGYSLCCHPCYQMRPLCELLGCFSDTYLSLRVLLFRRSGTAAKSGPESQGAAPEQPGICRRALPGAACKCARQLHHRTTIGAGGCRVYSRHPV